MWRLDYPWLLAVLAAGLAVYRWLPPYMEPRSALRVPFFNEIAAATGQRASLPGLRRSPMQRAVYTLVFALAVLALCRPVRVEPPTVHHQAVRDMVLAVDISQSMETVDIAAAGAAPHDRLSVVKAVVNTFIAARTDDRIGLTIFGSAAYPQAPLTMDHGTVQELLAQLQPGMAGPNTAIGVAIGLAIKQFDQTPAADKILILLTDGADTGSAIPPGQAAQMAAQRNIVIHTIGIGDPNAQGEGRADFAALQSIAQITGGRFFSAADADALAAVYETLNRSIPHDTTVITHQPKHDFFWVPLGVALALLVLLQFYLMAAAYLTQTRAARGEAAWPST